MIRIIHYTDAISSWCYMNDLQMQPFFERLPDGVSYEWRTALVQTAGERGFSREQFAWYYNRSNHVAGVQLNAGWYYPGYTSDNLNGALEAARELGHPEPGLRVALMRRILQNGEPLMEHGGFYEAIAALTGLDESGLRRVAESGSVRERMALSTAEFESLGFTQRPAYVIESDLDDRATFNGVFDAAPIIASVKAMVHDAKAYEHYHEKAGPIPG